MADLVSKSDKPIASYLKNVPHNGLPFDNQLIKRVTDAFTRNIDEIGVQFGNSNCDVYTRLVCNNRKTETKDIIIPTVII